MVIKYAELYLKTRQALQEKEGVYAPNIARELICAASGKTQEQMLADRDLYVPEETAERAVSYLKRYLKGEPIPYIIGEWNFYDMTLEVTPDVLIPRDDTNVVTELAIKKALFLSDNPRILDLCTGSGCIGLAIAKRVKDARVTLGDISEPALKVAKKNIVNQKMTGRVKCLTVDALKPAPEFLGKFDLIVSNPPYITGEDMKSLDPSVRDFEPHLALYGGEDGLDFYRSIVSNFSAALNPGGFLCFEFGIGQENSVCEILESGGFEILELRKDTGEITRAVLARKREEV